MVEKKAAAKKKKRPSSKGKEGGRKKKSGSNKERKPGVSTIDTKPLDAPIDKERLSLDELDEIDEQRRERGRQLAIDLYELTNVTRAVDPDVYIDTINKASLDCTSEENQLILTTARSYFIEKYGEELRGRGHSPKVEDEIVHRTGKESRAAIEKALDGFDVNAISQEIWVLALQRVDNLHEEVSQRMYPLTNRQVKELRSEYNQIPARMLAGYLHDALWRMDLEGRPFPDVVSIGYILRGRTSHEVKQIEFQYNEMFHYVRTGDGEPTLRELINEKLEGAALEQITELMEGFNPELAAKEVHVLLKNCAEVGEVNEEGDELAQDFSGVFRRDYRKYPPWERELRARDAVESATKHLTPEQFDEVNAVLKEHYHEELTQDLYTCNISKDPRKIALNLYKALFNVEARVQRHRDDDYLSQQELLRVKDEFRLSNNREIRDIIRYHANEVKARDALRRVRMGLVPLEYLDTNTIHEVRQEFLATAGIDIDEFVRGSIDEICRGDVPPYVMTHCEHRLSGLLRAPLRADLFELFSTERQRIKKSIFARRKIKIEAEAEDLYEKLMPVLEADTSYDTKAQEVISLLRGKSHDVIMELEKTFFEHSDDNKPLIRLLEEQFDGDEILEMEALMNDFDPESHAESIHNDLLTMSKLIHAPADAIILTMNRYRKKFGLDLLARIEKEYAEQEHARSHALALSVLYTPDVVHMKGILSSEDELDEKQLKEFIRHLAKPRLEILAYEASYNRHYSKFEYCFERHYGSLLLRLRVLASKEILPRSYFSEAILLLEGINPTITAELHNYLSTPDIKGPHLLAAQDILRENRYDLNTIKKSYNALNANETLRETIYNLQIPLVGINKTLLLLDGFDPDALAKAVHFAIETQEGEKLGVEILRLLAIPKPGHPNPRIPRHVNWTGEMYHQIRIAYESLYGKKLISELIRRGVPFKEKGINAIAYKLYGEVALSVVDVYKMAHVQLNDPEEDLEKVSKKLLHSLKILIPALRERLIDMYDAYFAIQDDHLPLRDQLKASIKDEKLLKLLNKLLDETLEWEMPNTVGETRGGQDQDPGEERPSQ